MNREDFNALNVYIDKEIMPFVTHNINKKYSIGAIRDKVERDINISVYSGLIAKLLKQRKVPCKNDKKGIIHFAISDECFYM